VSVESRVRRGRCCKERLWLCWWRYTAAYCRGVWSLTEGATEAQGTEVLASWTGSERGRRFLEKRIVSVLWVFNRSFHLVKYCSEVVTGWHSLRETVSGQQDWVRISGSSAYKARWACVDDVASLGYVAVRATVYFEIVFYVSIRKNIGLKRHGLIFTFYLFLLEIRHHMRVFS